MAVVIRSVGALCVLALVVGCRSRSDSDRVTATVSSSTSLAVSQMRSGEVARVVVPLDRLPESTFQVRDLFIQYTAEPDPEEKRLFTSAYLGSHFCLQEFPEPTRELLTPSKVDAMLAPPMQRTLRSVLECGEELQRRWTSPYVTVFRFVVADAPVDVRVVQLNLDDLPTRFGFVPKSISGLPGYCQGEADGGCAFESIHRGTMWMFGRAPAIETMARSLVAPISQASAQIGSEVSSALDALEPLMQRYVSLGNKQPGQVLREALGSMSEAYADTEALSPDIVTSFNALVAQSVAAAYTFDRPISGTLAGAFLLVAASDNATRALEASMVTFTERWKTSLAGAPDTAIVRAVRHATPIRQGQTVLLTLREPLSAQEASSAATTERGKLEKEASVATIFKAILRGDPPPPDEVAKLRTGWEPKVLRTR